MVNRRTFLKGAGTAGIAGLAGCLGGDGDGDGSGDTTTSGDGGDGGDGGDTTSGTTTGGSGDTTVTFVLTPSESDVDVQAQYEGVFNYLESNTDATIESTMASDYAAVYQAFKSNQADVADASPTLAVVGGNEGITEVLGIRIAYGAAKYFSLITTTPDSGVSELGDIEGKTMAFADRLSTSGSLFPLFALKQAGLDIGDAPSGSPNAFTGKWSDHSTARDQMISRDDIVAAGTGAFSVAPYVPKDQFSDQFLEISAENDGDLGTEDQQLDLVHESDPIPRAPILMRSSWDSPVKQQVQEALLSATEDDLKGGNAEEEIWFTGLQEGSLEDYAPVENVKNELGLEFGN